MKRSLGMLVESVIRVEKKKKKYGGVIHSPPAGGVRSLVWLLYINYTTLEMRPSVVIGRARWNHTFVCRCCRRTADGEC